MCSGENGVLKILSYPHNSPPIQSFCICKNRLSTFLRWISGKLNVCLCHFSPFFAVFRQKTTGYPQENSGKKKSTIVNVENLSTFSTYFPHKNGDFSKNVIILRKSSKNYPQFRKNRCGKVRFIHICLKRRVLHNRYKCIFSEKNDICPQEYTRKSDSNPHFLQGNFFEL